MLDNSLEAVEAGVPFAPVSITQKKLLAEVLRQRLEFVIVYPLHVVQD
jgi:hypothetical protein